MHTHALTVVPHDLCRAAEPTLHAPEQCKSTTLGHAFHVTSMAWVELTQQGATSPRHHGIS